MAGTRFGRNVPLDKIPPSSDADVLARPSPREVSRRLMTRHELNAAEGLNSLAAAWLQFMIHDWFSHGKSPKENPWVVELTEDDAATKVAMLAEYATQAQLGRAYTDAEFLRSAARFRGAQGRLPLAEMFEVISLVWRTR